MTAQIPSVLKSYFETNDRPTQGQFADLIDSCINVVQTGSQTIVSDVSALGTLSVAGNAAFGGTISVSGALASQGLSINASGQSTLSGNTTIGGTLSVANILSVTGSAQSNLSGNIIVSGNATFANLVGVTNGVAAPSGIVGEVISGSVLAGSAIALTNNAPSNVTSIALTAGDWDVAIQGYFVGADTTTLAYAYATISPTTGTLNTTPGQWGALGNFGAGTPFASASVFGTNAGPMRVSLAAPATYYFVAQAGFGTSTCSVYGTLFARRRR